MFLLVSCQSVLVMADLYVYVYVRVHVRSLSLCVCVCVCVCAEFDGVFLSNGPGDPELCSATVDHIAR